MNLTPLFSATGLTYAQQRYYDPVIGRFLSADPVTTEQKGGTFNRYWYANNNPYKFTDPDGRCVGTHICGPDGPLGPAENARSVGPINGVPTHNYQTGSKSDRHVYALEKGDVTTIGWQTPNKHHGEGAGLGYRVKIDIGNNNTRIYGHMDPDNINVAEGNHVDQGQLVGSYASPTNGHSSGPHVHVQLMDAGNIVDPGNMSPLANQTGHVTTEYSARDALHPHPHQGIDWVYDNEH